MLPLRLPRSAWPLIAPGTTLVVLGGLAFAFAPGLPGLIAAVAGAGIVGLLAVIATGRRANAMPDALHEPAPAAAATATVAFDVSAQASVEGHAELSNYLPELTSSLPESPGPDDRLRRGLLAHSAQSIVTTDAAGLVESFSRGAERLLGYRAEEIVGLRSLVSFHDEFELSDRAADLTIQLDRPIASGFEAIVAGVNPAEVESIAPELCESAAPEEREWTWLRRNGTRVPVRLSITPLCDVRGKISGYIAIASDLTEHKQAEERRREFDTRLSKIAGQVPGMLFQLRQTPDGRRSFAYVSDGVRELYRVEPAAALRDARVLWAAIHPDDAARVRESIDASAARVERWQCEYRTRFKDGTVRWLLGTALPERQADGAIVWHGFITDVTERKRGEQVVEENRVLLQGIFSSVDLGVFVVDVCDGGEFRFVEANPAYERLIGITASELRGRRPKDLVPIISSELAEGMRATFRRGAESTGPIEVEEPFMIRGRLSWSLTRLHPLHDAAGNVIRLIGRALDITERKNIEQRFQYLTERLQLATEAARLGIWDYDLGHHVVVWDQRMHELYGYGPGEFDGTYEAWKSRVHPEDLPRAEKELADAIEGRGVFNTLYRVVHPNGDIREVRASAHIQRHPSGRALRVVGVNWDVTAERRAQAEVAQARDRAEVLNSQLQAALERAETFARVAEAATVAKSEFLANMSHEIRTPLNAVIGMSGLLLNTDLNEEQREFAQTIRSSGDGLLALINDILDYSKIESGKLDLEQRTFDLRDCLESSLDVLSARAAEKKLDLLYQMVEGVPEAIVGDDTRLRQVIVNLLSNAVKFTARGEVFLSAHVVARHDGGRLRLQFGVHDSGIGIPADRMDRLFKTFSQVDNSTTRQYGGTGLGLAITKRIVELMGGRIWVESQTGKGSTFYFEIETAVATVEAKAHASGRSPRLEGRRVLIVDDNATTCRVLCHQTVAWGLMPRAVASAAEALRVLETDTYALVLADVDMPGMDGVELARELRRRRPAAELAIALLSGPGRPRLPDELAIAGFVNKPVKPAALFELLIDVLHGRQAARPKPVNTEDNLGATHPLHVLLVEDNPVNHRVATLMLQRLGYRADVASNGLEALEAVARQRYDLVLMDVQMPEMDGITAAREICARWPENARPRIVAMTANASTADRDACLAAGMNDFMTKPVRAADLRKALLGTTARIVANAA